MTLTCTKRRKSSNCVSVGEASCLTSLSAHEPQQYGISCRAVIEKLGMVSPEPYTIAPLWADTAWARLAGTTMDALLRREISILALRVEEVTKLVGKEGAHKSEFRQGLTVRRVCCQCAKGCV